MLNSRCDSGTTEHFPRVVPQILLGDTMNGCCLPSCRQKDSRTQELAEEDAIVFSATSLRLYEYNVPSVAVTTRNFVPGFFLSLLGKKNKVENCVFIYQE